MRRLCMGLSMVVALVSARAEAGETCLWKQGEVRAAPDGPAVELKDPSPGRVEIVGAQGELIQVRVRQSPDIDLWIRAGDVATVVTSTSFLAASEKALGKKVAPTTPGVRLHPGAEVTVLERGKRGARVRFAGRGVKAEGWLPLAALGQRYVPALDEAPSTDPAYLVGPTTLLAAPGGKPLQVVDKAAHLDNPEVKRLGQAKKGHVLVERVDEWTTVVGWVPAARVETGVLGGLGVLGGVLGDSRYIKVPAGTPILVAPRGVAIGRYASEDVLLPLETRDGHVRLSLWTELGEITAWVPTPPPAKAASKKPGT